MSKTAITKKQSIGKKENPNLLNVVPFESGFHFYTELGKYTGITASSTVEFAEKIQKISIQSVTFHFHRQDFQKWFRNTIGDKELAERIGKIKEGLQGENLRKALFEMVQNRISELQ